MAIYRPTIGIEAHIELSTKTKMFCACLNAGEGLRPNTNVCPVCLGHPGALPTMNREAVRSVVRLGLALGATIPEVSSFDRKSYTYPDLPKGYQISQYERPLTLGGSLHGVRIRRVHLEEDTGRLAHEEGVSLVDYNRAGVPLMELVTEPDIHDAETAVVFAKELQLLLRHLGIATADMERGEMRVEANISVSADDSFGTKVEVKNLNSFKSVGEAVAYEVRRQAELLSSGKKVAQETRGWDEARRATVSQRSKEEAHDYRYLPEPDLPPIETRSAPWLDLELLRAELPELPREKYRRFREEFSLRDDQAEALVQDRALAAYFEEAVSELATDLRDEAFGEGVQLLVAYLTSDLRGILNARSLELSELRVTPAHLAHLVHLVQSGELSSRMAKDILLRMAETGLDPHVIIERDGVRQISDEGALRAAAAAVIGEFPEPVADYRGGKTSALQFLVGQTMKRLGGLGNPVLIRVILEELLRRIS